MFEAILVAWVTVFFLTLASIADLRTGEIPEKISWGLAVSILVLAITHSTIVSDATPLILTIGIGLIFFTFAYLVYRMGQWGGGDVKLMGGIGCSLGLIDAMGFIWPNTRLMPYPISYIVAMGFLALPYAVTYSLYLSVKKPAVFTQFAENLKDTKKQLLIVCSLTPALITAKLGYPILVEIYLLVPVSIIALIFLRAVEEKALRKEIPVKDLVEGDVLAEEIKTGEKTIKPEHAIEGLSLAQVEELKTLAGEGKIPWEVTVKWGVKFAPILLFSYALTVWVGNLLEIVFVELLV